MYNRMHNEIFEGIITAALGEFIAQELEALPSDGEMAQMYPAPEKLLRRYKRKSRELEYRTPMALIYLRRAAVIVLMLTTFTFATLITSEAVRDAIKRTVVEWHDDYISIDFEYSETSQEDAAGAPETEAVTAGELAVGYIPEAFILSSSIESENLSEREYVYMSGDGSMYFVIGIYDTDTTSVGADIEHSEYEELTVNGCDGYMTYHESERSGAIVFGNKEYTVSVSGIIEKEELLKIAQGIK